MSNIVEIKRAYDCLTDFRDNRNEEYKKLINIFFPILHKKSECYLEISIGKKMSEMKFQSMLSIVTTCFIVKLSRWNNEPQFIIYDVDHHNTIAVFNLALIENLYVGNDGNDSYNIDFNYNNEIDYCIHINKEK